MSDYVMWKYWRDKKGYEKALTEQFEEEIESNANLKAALISIQNAKTVIDTIMTDMDNLLNQF